MPWNESQLPDLATTGGGYGIQEQDNPLIEALMRRKIEGRFGPVGFEINAKRAKLEAKYRDAIAKALLNYDGTFDVSAQKPFMGGDIKLNAEGGNDISPRFGVQFRKSF